MGARHFVLVALGACAVGACGSGSSAAGRNGDGDGPGADAATSSDGAAFIDAPSGGDTAGALEAGEAPDASGGSTDAAASGGGLPEPVPACSNPGAPIIAARDFLDAWGVNATVSAASAATTAAQLNRIGFRRIRAPLWAESLGSWQALASAMTAAAYTKPKLRFNALVDAYNNTSSITWDDQQPGLIAAGASGLLGSIEGPNEMNNAGVGNGSHGVNDTTDDTSSWAGATGNLYQWMHAIRAWRDGLTGTDAQAMKGVELIAPTISVGDYAMMPDLASLVDYGALHYYSGNGLQPSLGQASDNPGVGYFANVYASCQAAVSPGKPLVVSECGATTAPGGTYTQHAQAAYYLNRESRGRGHRCQALLLLRTGRSGHGHSRRYGGQLSPASSRAMERTRMRASPCIGSRA